MEEFGIEIELHVDREWAEICISYRKEGHELCSLHCGIRFNYKDKHRSLIEIEKELKRRAIELFNHVNSLCQQHELHIPLDEKA